MASINIRRLYGATRALLKSHLDAFVDDIEGFFNTTKISDDNLQNAGITASTKFVSGSVSTEKIDNAQITTAKLADGSVTADKIAASQITTAKIADSAVTTDKLADDAVTTAKIPDRELDRTKLASALKTTAVGETASLSVNTTSMTFVQDTYAQLSTTGRPVLVQLQGSDVHSGSVILTASGGSTNQYSEMYVTIQIRRDTDGAGLQTVYSTECYTTFDCNSNTYVLRIPASTVKVLDVPPAGTQRYSLWINRVRTYGDASSYTVSASAGMVAKELI